MTPEDKKIAMDVRVKQMEIALLGVARAADRECSDISLAMGHDGGRGWDPDAHLQPIVDAIAAALRERDAAWASAASRVGICSECNEAFAFRPVDKACRFCAPLRALLEEAGK